MFPIKSTYKPILPSTTTQSTSNDYNGMLDAFVKLRLNFVQNDAHPCMRKGLCKKGSKCPFIGLPNDTCLHHLTDVCRFGNQCENTHYDEYAEMHKDAKEEFKQNLEKDRLNAAEEIERDKQYLGEKTRMCPTCVVPVEKIDGCPTMTCPKCRTNFNWDQMKYANGSANLRIFQEVQKEAVNLRLRPLSTINVIVIGLNRKRFIVTLESSNV